MSSGEPFSGSRVCKPHFPSFSSLSFVTLLPAHVWRSGVLDWRVAQQLSTSADLLEDLDSIPSTRVTAHSICNPSPRESAALFWPQRAPDLQYSGWSQRPTLLQICTHSSESVFISPSFLKDIFPEFKILYRQHFSFWHFRKCLWIFFWPLWFLLRKPQPLYLCSQ